MRGKNQLTKESPHRFPASIVVRDPREVKLSPRVAHYAESLSWKNFPFPRKRLDVMFSPWGIRVSLLHPKRFHPSLYIPGLCYTGSSISPPSSFCLLHLFSLFLLEASRTRSKRLQGPSELSKKKNLGPRWVCPF